MSDTGGSSSPRLGKSQVHPAKVGETHSVVPQAANMAKENTGFEAGESMELKATKTTAPEHHAPPPALVEKSSEQWQTDVAKFIRTKGIKQINEHKKTEEDTDSFGEIEFVGFGQSTNKKAPYIRVHENTNVSWLWELLTKQWKMPKPKVLISVTGGALNFFFKDDRLKILFNKGLFKAAISTGAWIITGGTATGVMKKVGEAIKEESRGTTENEVIALGIATWNVIDNKKVLQPNTEGLWPAKYREKELKHKTEDDFNLAALDSNHTHFILVDHGKEKYGADIKLRAKLEQHIAKCPDPSETEITPVVLVVVEGGYGTIETVYQSLSPSSGDEKTHVENTGTPVVIVDGSGRAADIIAKSLRLKAVDDSVTASINEMLKDEKDEEKRTEMVKKCENWLKEIIDPKNGKLITVFHMKDENFKDIDRAILHGVLQAQALTDKLPEQLKLALALNRCDIAKDEIITADRQSEWQKQTLDEIVRLSLVDNKPDFVELFLAHIVDLDKFLTCNMLYHLYNLTINKVVDDADSRVGTKHIIKEKLEDYKSKSGLLPSVGLLFRDLTDDEYEVLYQKDEYKVKGSQDDTVPDPEKHLFLWAVLLNRQSMAKLFWKRLDTGNIGAALVAGRILRALSGFAKKKEELTVHFDLLKNASEFENLATGVLEICYESDKDLSKLALVRTLPAWGHTTCLSIAYAAKHMNFMEHDCCQSKMQRIWKGNLLIHSSWQWFLFFLGTILPLFPFMTFMAKDHVELYKHGGGQQKTNRTNKVTKYLCRWKSIYPQEITEVRHSGGGDYDVTFWEGMRYYYTAPITKFLYNMISYIIMLFLFGIFIMTDLRPAEEANSPGVMEWIVIAWVGTLIIEEIRQLVVREPNSFRYKLGSWSSEVWNRFDFVMYLLFMTSVLLRFVLPPSKFAVARLMYCLTFISFCIRLLHMGFVFKEVGPKIIMIIKMMKDLAYFLFILIVFIASFGVANEAILYPNMEPKWELMVRALYKPYWQLYGELFLDEIEGLVDNGTCYEDPRYLNACPQPEYRWVAPTLTAIYMLISNILLINLLIAMFSFTFQRVQDNAEVIWRFYRFGLISEYQDRPTLAPPLIIINHGWRLIKYCLKKCGDNMQSHSLAVRLDDRHEEILNLFERKHMENYFIKQNQEQMKSIENTVSSTDKRLDTVVHEVGEIKESISGSQPGVRTADAMETSHVSGGGDSRADLKSIDKRIKKIEDSMEEMKRNIAKILERMEK